MTIPASLAAAVRRMAREQQLTMSRALVTLAERGIEAEAASRENLKVAYHHFMSAAEPGPKNEAGRDLIRAIFGKDAVAEDSIR